MVIIIIIFFFFVSLFPLHMPHTVYLSTQVSLHLRFPYDVSPSHSSLLNLVFRRTHQSLIIKVKKASSLTHSLIPSV
jgi:hypothetical protein